jgi:hypothetical protein
VRQHGLSLGSKHPFQEHGGLRQRLVGVADDAAQVDEGVDLALGLSVPTALLVRADEVIE